jgi:hypothetical protein
MSASFVLGSQTSSTYPGGYASGVCSPAASLSEHFEQAAGIGIPPESDLRRLLLVVESVRSLSIEEWSPIYDA